MNSFNWEVFVQRYKDCKKDEGSTDKEIADYCGICYSTLRDYVKQGRCTIPRADIICALCDFFGCSSDWLMGRK